VTAWDVSDAVVLTAPASQLQPGELTLSPEESHHARVRRLAPGTTVHLVDGQGGRALAEIEGPRGPALRVRVLSVRHEPRPCPQVTLVQALIKGDRAMAAVEMACEAGVDRIIPWQAERSVVRWRGPRAEQSLAKWRSAVVSAGKQSRRSWFPDVEPVRTSAQLAQVLAGADLALVLDAGAAMRLSAMSLPERGSIVLVVGPEGGLSPGEIDTFVRAGAITTRLGSPILRAGTAGVAALAVVMANSGRWD